MGAFIFGAAIGAASVFGGLVIRQCQRSSDMRRLIAVSAKAHASSLRAMNGKEN